MKKTMLIFAVVLFGLAGCNRTGGLVEISNANLSLGFERQTGKLVSFVDKTKGVEMIDSAAVKGYPWRLAGEENFTQDAGYTVSFKKKNPESLNIVWKYAGENPVEVSMDVTLEKSRPMSHWRASFKGLEPVKCESVIYPVISGVKAYENADLILPSWLGNLRHDPAEDATEEKPKVYKYRFPGSSAQLMALYDRESQKHGLYMAGQDTTSLAKYMVFSLTPSHAACSAQILIPDGRKVNTFDPGFDIVIGSFDGDWLSAAKIYREWAVQTKFCRESRFRNGESPEWLPKTAFWIWNRGRSSNVLTEAEDVQARLGLPVNAYWHWWHGCSYDDGFPEYVPPREGAESFTKAVDHAHKQGIHSLVYMNSYQWGDATESFKTTGAEKYVARKENGGTYRHVYQIFSGKGLTPMCMGTQFWRDKYASLCDIVVNQYHVDGVYMDQACNGMPCYDPNHGHPVGGGSTWRDGFGMLTDQIRGTFKDRKDVMLGGEGSAEDWIPILDDFLTLQASQERYGGVGKTEPIPLFVAIYHDYAMVYGSYSSLVYPPYDELWTKEFRPANAETLLPEEFNMQFRMEQARSFTWGMQPTLANYHSFLFDKRKAEMEFLVNLVKTRYNALPYLLYGELIDFPQMRTKEVTIPISKISIYAGRKGDVMTRFEKKVPTLYSAAWRSKEGNVGVAVSNISDEAAEVAFTVDAARYGLPKAGAINLIKADKKMTIGQYVDQYQVVYTIAPRSNVVIELAK